MGKKVRYRKRASERGRSAAALARRADDDAQHLTARTGESVLLQRLVMSHLTQAERRNDLPLLTPQRAAELYEAWRRGEMAEIQLMFEQLEQRDETLRTVLNARLSALAEMPWRVVVDADAVAGDPDLERVARVQKRYAMQWMGAVENLEEALVHLGMADFRGVAALEVTGNAQRMRWEVIEPWNLCRPNRREPWMYNESATAVPGALELLDPAAVMIREAEPIDLPAMFLLTAKYHAIAAWDAFLDTFGIPNIFFEMPPATTEARAAEYDAIVTRIIGEGRGTIPSGAKFHTIETTKDNTQSFEARAKWCNEAIITLATGGLLTVATAPDSGTLAGSAHTDSFTRLCAASARSISSVVTRQWLHRMLRETFPAGPLLVRFELAPEPADERADMAALFAQLLQAGWKPEAATVAESMGFAVTASTMNNGSAVSDITALATAGYRTPDEQVNDITGLRVTSANMDSTAIYAAKAAGYVPTQEAMQQRMGMPLKPAPMADADTQPVVNRMSEEVQRGEPEALTPEELEALRSLAEVRLDDLVAQDTETAEAALTEAVEGVEAPASEDLTDEGLENRTYKRDRNGQFASTGAAQHSPRHSRASKGNPKNPTTQSNTPLKAAPGAKAQAQVDAVEHALKAHEGGGGVAEGAARVGGKRLDVLGGSPDTGGASHMTKHYRPGDTSRRDAAKTAVLGQKQKDRTEVASVRRSGKVILADKGDHYTIVTTRKKTDKD